jgi:acyl-CoA thioesterase FadM
MRPDCERCGADLPAEAPGAFVCSFECTFTAEPQHIDVMGHVNNAVWVQWMEAIATAHWEAVAAPEHQAAYAWS